MKRLMASTLFLFLLASCKSNEIQEVLVDNGACFLPPSLDENEIERVIKFGTNISGIAKYVAGVEIETEIDSNINNYYPAADDVNRIYALTFAACVSCRVTPEKISACAARFDSIIAKYTSQTNESTALNRAEEYQKNIFSKLQ